MSDSHWLTDEQVRKVIRNFLKNDGPHDSEEITKVVRWAEEAVIHKTMLEMVLEGTIALKLVDGKVMCKSSID